mmetsp:Transcript_96239/g.310503  ORF Transcript_96239/g.310503 Transcript_96239/m.310503 type:complete len:343 (+) Transcript_96239:477-1505(+)
MSPAVGLRFALFLKYAITRQVNQDQSSNVPLNLAAAPGMPTPPPMLPGTSAVELGELLRQMMLLLLDKFSDPSSGDVDYVQMKDSSEWSSFRALAAELGEGRLQGEMLNMGENDRKAFFINLYNAMTFHGIVAFGRRPGTWSLYCFFITPAVSYRLAGVQVSLDDVENGWLRRQPGYFEGAEQSFQKSMCMQELDPRIHMALNCGAKGCPAVAVYRAEALDSELDGAVAAFVESDLNVRVVAKDGSVVEAGAKAKGGKLRVEMTELFKMYIADFAGDGADAGKQGTQAAVIRWVLKYTTPEKKQLLTDALESGSFGFEWLAYDWSTNGPDLPTDSRIYSPTF